MKEAKPYPPLIIGLGPKRKIWEIKELMQLFGNYGKL
jgi:hypothetical protein